jgi:hypothetical protein
MQAKRTIYVQIVIDGDTYDPDGYRPWLNCTGPPMDTVRLAIHKHLRENGYIHGSVPVVNLEVFFFPADSPRHGNGRPMCVRSLKVKCSLREAA